MQITSWMKHCGGEDEILSRKKGEESRSNHGVTHEGVTQGEELHAGRCGCQVRLERKEGQ